MSSTEPGPSEKKKVIVTGDITLDWYLARDTVAQETGETRVLSRTHYMQGYRKAGGASLLGELIRKAADSARAEVEVPDPLKRAETERIPGAPPYWHSYSVCSRFLVPGESKKSEPKKYVWRVSDFLGFDRQWYKDERGRAESLTKDQEEGGADVLVVHDANQHHEDLKNERDDKDAWIWPASLREPSEKTWVVMRRALRALGAQSTIWKHVAQEFKDKLIAVVTVDDLRLVGMQISRRLSWDRSIRDLVTEMNRPSSRHTFSGCKHLVVSFGTEGAVVFSNFSDSAKNQPVTVYYDPRNMEGGWRSKFHGEMRGHSNCLVAGIALQMIQSEQLISSDSLKLGILAGLAASRDLHEEGFWVTEEKKKFPGSPFPQDLGFPFERLAKRLKDDHKGEPFLELRLAADDVAKDWTILNKRFECPGEVFRLAKEIVKWGISDSEVYRKLEVPIEEFGKLSSIDQSEIEGLTAIKLVMEEYVRSRGQRVPLSVAVFGKPGSGKSFAIKQVAKALPEGWLKELPAAFNLSQFTGPESIVNALHQVRDVALSGTVPLVFWDEFDSRLGSTDTELGWLRYFLSPMQDGTFQAGSNTHQIGQAVFVFAGGVYSTFADFKRKEKELEYAKISDFISRLKGYVDIPGLNYENAEIENGVLLRRALLLRSIISEAAPNLVQEVEGGPRKPIDVDSGVLTAFLLVQRYEYGTRSMEAIVRMSALSDKTIFNPSSLPAQLAPHVNPEEFLKLVSNKEKAESAADQGTDELIKFLRWVRGNGEAKESKTAA
jgi:hypothetical protein